MSSITRTCIPHSAFVWLGFVLLLCTSGCKSTSPAGSGADKPPLVMNPRPVVVRDFAFDVAQLRTDQGLLARREGPAKRVLGNLRAEDTPSEKAAKLAALLSESIAKELTELKIPASRAAQGSSMPSEGLVVGGEFLQVDEGNRLKRAVVGFGAGASEVLVQVAVYDLEQSREKPILVYGTGTGSKPMPGGIVSMNPYAIAAKYVLSRNASEKDVRKLGKQIARDLCQIEAGGHPKH